MKKNNFNLSLMVSLPLLIFSVSIEQNKANANSPGLVTADVEKRVSSPEEISAVVLYDNFNGSSMLRYHDNIVEERSLVPLGINDKISSVRLASGFQITLYEKVNFEGKSITFNNETRESVIYNLSGGNSDLNDKTSSYRITREPSDPNEWINVTLPTSAFFQSDGNTNHTTLISSDFEIVNHSGRAVLVEMQDYDGMVGNIKDLNVTSVSGGKTAQVISEGVLSHDSGELMELDSPDPTAPSYSGINSDKFNFRGTTQSSWSLTHQPETVDASMTLRFIPDQTLVNVKDSTIYTSDNWQASDNFVSGTNRDGNPLDFSQLTVSGTVDTNTPGTYQITYSYGDISSVATVTVLQDFTTVNVKDSTLLLGESWQASDNFVSATDRDGNPLDFSQLTVSGTVDTNTPGTYQITYSYGSVSSVATVVLEEHKIVINTKSFDEWTPGPGMSHTIDWSRCFVSGTDEKGNPLDVSQLSISIFTVPDSTAVGLDGFTASDDGITTSKGFMNSVQFTYRGVNSATATYKVDHQKLVLSSTPIYAPAFTLDLIFKNIVSAYNSNGEATTINDEFSIGIIQNGDDFFGPDEDSTVIFRIRQDYFLNQSYNLTRHPL